MDQIQVEKFAAKIATSEGKEVLRARMDNDGLIILFTDGVKKRYDHGVFSKFAHEVKATAPKSPAGDGVVGKDRPTPPPASPSRKK